MFDDFELSARGGRPRQLFIFTRQTATWRLTNGDRAVTIGGNTYIAAPIDRSEIKQTVEKPQDQIIITFPYTRDPNAAEQPVTQDLGNIWFPYVPHDAVSVICMDYHADDPDLQAVVKWQGRVAQPKYNDKAGTLELTCVRNHSSDKNRRRGPKWQKNCWKTTYSTGLRGCLLVKADFEIAAVLTGASGFTLTAAAFGTAPLSLTGGDLSWTRADGLQESRPIVAHNGTSITLLYGGADLAPGLAVTALPNCPGTWAACTARNNTIHYGGSVYEPIESPYDGGSMSWS